MYLFNISHFRFIHNTWTRRVRRRVKEVKEQFNTIYVPIKETPVSHSPQILPALSTIIAGVTKNGVARSTIIMPSGPIVLL
jgi:hypothetical protein